jgi:hypothetical protein
MERKGLASRNLSESLAWARFEAILITRLELIRASDYVDSAKAQLIRDMANVHNSHAGRMFMAKDSHKIIAWAEARRDRLRSQLTDLEG